MKAANSIKIQGARGLDGSKSHKSYAKELGCDDQVASRDGCVSRNTSKVPCSISTEERQPHLRRLKERIIHFRVVS